MTICIDNQYILASNIGFDCDQIYIQWIIKQIKPMAEDAIKNLWV